MDDFALRRRRRYATVLIGAQTRERVDVLPDRKADTLETWPRDHPAPQAERLVRTLQYRLTLVDPYRDHPRR